MQDLTNEFKPQPKISQAPNLQPPKLTNDEINDCLNAMVGCDDFEALKGIFGGAFKRATDAQKTTLSETYNTKKSLLQKAA